MKNGGTVALTGGIGSGKSQAAALLRKQGYTVYSCDEIYKELSVDKNYLKDLKILFPMAVNENGLNRKALSEIVFNNPSELKKLNSFSHPKIMKELNRKIQNSVGWRFAEVPLLFEGGYEKNFDFIIVVLRDLEERISSVCVRDGVNKEEVLTRIFNQYDYTVFLKKSKPLKNVFILNNDGSIEEMKYNLIKILEEIKQS